VSGHIIVRRRSGAAQVANLRSALVRKSHFEKMHIPFVRMFATHLPRVSKEWVSRDGLGICWKTIRPPGDAERKASPEGGVYVVI
jgi:hypothetical protein